MRGTHKLEDKLALNDRSVCVLIDKFIFEKSRQPEATPHLIRFQISHFSKIADRESYARDSKFLKKVTDFFPAVRHDFHDDQPSQKCNKNKKKHI